MHVGNFWRWKSPYVDEIIVCDPRQCALIRRNAHKNDDNDVYNLCRLLRLGELKGVYHPEEDHRATFKSAVQHYLDLRDQQRGLKTKIKAKFRGAGVMEVYGDRAYGAKHRAWYLDQINESTLRSIVGQLYDALDTLFETQARHQMVQLGKRYPEIWECMKMPVPSEPMSLMRLFRRRIALPRRKSCGAIASSALSSV